ncbi:unnamed protein product, partial [Nesidiocoris tenuis]
LPSSGSTPAPWEYSRPLGVLPPPGSTPDPWEFSRPLGVLPPSGSTPALWEYSRPLGVLESSLSPLRSFHSQHFGKNNRRFLNPCIHSTFIPKYSGLSLTHLTCNRCHKQFAQYCSLARHRKECGQPPRFHCEFCQYKSHRKENLRIHTVNKHGNLISYRCHQCGKVFKHMSNFSTHRKWVCNKVPRFACSFCSYRAHQKSQLRAHIFRKHDFDWTPSASLPIPCPPSAENYFPPQGYPNLDLRLNKTYPSNGPQMPAVSNEAFLPGLPSTSVIPLTPKSDPSNSPPPVYPEVVHMTSPGESDAQTLANFCMNLSPLDNQLEGHS